MGPVEQRELDRRVKALEDRMNAWETWRTDIEKKVSDTTVSTRKDRKKSED